MTRFVLAVSAAVGLGGKAAGWRNRRSNERKRGPTVRPPLLVFPCRTVAGCRAAPTSGRSCDLGSMTEW